MKTLHVLLFHTFMYCSLTFGVTHVTMVTAATLISNLSRWRAKVILLRIPVRDRPEVQLKAIAFGALDNRRRNWGYNRKWLGNYLMQQVKREKGGRRGRRRGRRERERGGKKGRARRESRNGRGE